MCVLSGEGGKRGLGKAADRHKAKSGCVGTNPSRTRHWQLHDICQPNNIAYVDTNPAHPYQKRLCLAATNPGVTHPLTSHTGSCTITISPTTLFVLTPALLSPTTHPPGIGNIYRAEILFKAGVHPEQPACTLDRSTFDRIWGHSVTLLQRGFVSGSILTVDPEEAKVLGKPWTRRWVRVGGGAGKRGNKEVGGWVALLLSWGFAC